jgi:phage terminase large subunit
MINIEIDKRHINSVYRPFLNDQTRTQILFGGASSGKSRFIAQRSVIDLLNGDRNYLVVRNTGRTHKFSTYNEITKVINGWDLSKLFTINKSELTITCANRYQALFVGLDDVEKIKSITPAKGVITDVWVEEATETGEDDNKQLTKRLRGISRVAKRFTYSFNPIMKTHWLYKTFFLNRFLDTDKDYRDPELAILRTTYKDNAFLAPDDIQALESETNEYYYNVYTLGQWGVLGHLVFNNWRVEDLTKARDSFGTYYNGLDWGYTNDPTAFIRCAVKGKKLYITNAFYEYGMTNDLIAGAVKQVIGNEPLRCDPSEPRSTQELRSYGVNAISAKGGKGSVNQGIQYIQHFDEVIIDRELQDVVNEFSLYQWEKNRAGEVMNVPVDKNNHSIDALRYALSGVSLAAPVAQLKPFDRSIFGLPV